jgi:septum formation protein
MVPIVLASASPRRQELLKQLVEEFEVLPADLDEDALTVPDPWQTAERLALAKALAIAKLRPGALVIGSDTVVAIELEPNIYFQLSKPKNVPVAIEMLRMLSHRTHLVITAIALVREGQHDVRADTTKVTFRNLSGKEVKAYVATGEPMDKAGAYAIQGGASGFVEKVEGSISNVIGLPLELLEEMLKGFL